MLLINFIRSFTYLFNPWICHHSPINRVNTSKIDFSLLWQQRYKRTTRLLYSPTHWIHPCGITEEKQMQPNKATSFRNHFDFSTCLSNDSGDFEETIWWWSLGVRHEQDICPLIWRTFYTVAAFGRKQQ